MTELTVEVTPLPAHRAVHIRAAGQLTRANRHPLRLAVLKSLTDCPTAVLVDVTDLQLLDRIAAAMFVPLYREACAGHPVPLLLFGASGMLAERLQALLPVLPRYRNQPEAVAAITARRAPPRSVYQVFPSRPETISMAGCLVGDACGRWHLPHLTHAARAATFDLLRTVCPAPTEGLAVFATFRPPGLILAVRDRLRSTHPGVCPVGRVTHWPGARAGPQFHHTITVTGHLRWAILPTDPS